MKLNLGSGTRYKEGYVNIDKSGAYKVDLIADITKLEYDNESVDEIMCRQLIMYFTPQELEREIKRWHRWLKPEGTLVIEIADLTIVCENILSAMKNLDYDLFNGPHGLMQLYGFEQTAGHKWAWNSFNLCPLLSIFNKVEWLPGTLAPERDFVVKCTK